MGQLTVSYNEQTAVFMLRLIRELVIGEALLSKPWRLERIDPLVGFEHYVLYCGTEVVGVQYVRAKSWLEPVQRGLAAYLTLIGFRPDSTTFGIARTSDRAEHNRFPLLFAMPLERRKVQVVKVGCGYDMLRLPYRLARLRYAADKPTKMPAPVLLR